MDADLGIAGARGRERARHVVGHEHELPGAPALLLCFFLPTKLLSCGTRDTRRRNLSSPGVCGRDQMRNTSYKEFMLVGPTGCKSGDTVNVTRKWVSAPYVGDDAVLPFSSQPPA